MKNYLNVDAEQKEELESEFKLIRFISRFSRLPVEQRNKVLLTAEEMCAGSNDEHINMACEFIKCLCESADIRDGDRHGA